MITRRPNAFRKSATFFNHYSMLATILDGFGLAPLGHTSDTANVHTMFELVPPQ